MIRRKFFALLLSLLILSTACSDNEHDVSESTASLLNPMSSSSEVSSDSSSFAPEVSSSTPETSSSNAEISMTSRDNNSLLILVNPENYIPEDYITELEPVQGKYKMDKRAAESARALLDAANSAGFNMLICSAYRTVEKSAELYERKVNEFLNAGYTEDTAKKEAAKWVAPPGTSEHHTGLAMDLVSSDYWGYYSDLEHDYENFDSFKWMYEHCAEFGFILRYPKDKQEITGITYEPWHYRYVGKDAAKYVMENHLCLEEYLELIQ